MKIRQQNAEGEMYVLSFIHVITIPSVLVSTILVLGLTVVGFKLVLDWRFLCGFLEWEAKVAASENALLNSSRSISSPFSSSKPSKKLVFETETEGAGEEATSRELVRDSSTLGDFWTRRARQLHRTRISTK